MCGRYTIRRLSDLIRLGIVQLPGFEEFSERVQQHGLFNVAPTQRVPIVRLNKDDKPAVDLAKWGLIPSWTTGTPQVQPINARSETAAASPMFRAAMERRRCLVLADGFYEWQGKHKPKQPFFIHMKPDRLFAFAGLWERWQPPGEPKPVDTFTILTTEPNELMKPIHNRMPVILDEADYARWLDRDNKPGAVAELLRPFPAEQMEAWKISTAVNSTRNNGDNLIQPLPAQ